LAIRTLGDAIDASLVDLKGGTTGQVLAKASNTDMDFTWATSADTNGLVFIKSQTFSNVANVDIDSAFTTTYTNYMVIFQNMLAATTTDDLQIQWRYSTTTQTTGYYATRNTQGSAAVIANDSNAAQLTIASNTGGSQVGFYEMKMMGMGVAATNYPFVTGSGYALNDTQGTFFAGSCNAQQQWTGFRIKSSSTNITGKVLVYGMVNA
jgi:hypothetical protein